MRLLRACWWRKRGFRDELLLRIMDETRLVLMLGFPWERTMTVLKLSYRDMCFWFLRFGCFWFTHPSLQTSVISLR